jgi:hypothetical protein
MEHTRDENPETGVLEVRDDLSCLARAERIRLDYRESPAASHVVVL